MSIETKKIKCSVCNIPFTYSEIIQHIDSKCGTLTPEMKKEKGISYYKKINRYSEAERLDFDVSVKQYLLFLQAEDEEERKYNGNIEEDMY